MSEGMLALWNERLLPQAGNVAARLALAALAVLVVTLVARVSLGAANRALGRTRAHVNARLLIDRVITFLFLLLAAIWVLSIFGIQLTAVVTVLGVVGLAVSLALQDVLKNLVAGLYILVERPFAIGEQIEFKTFSGVVETIELRITALRTAGGQRVIIPNAMLFAETLVNRSAYGRQLARLRIVVPLESGTDGKSVVEETAAALRSAAPTTTGASGAPEPSVYVESLTAEKLTLRAELWTADARATAPDVAWALRARIPRAEIAILE
jgi:small-conductance mechanosensitive channel